MLVKLASRTGISTTAFALRSGCVLPHQASCNIYKNFTSIFRSFSLFASAPEPAALIHIDSRALPHPRRDIYRFVSIASLAKYHCRLTGLSGFNFTLRDFWKKSGSPAYLLPDCASQQIFTRVAASTFSTASATTVTTVTAVGSGASNSYTSTSSFSSYSSSPSSTTTESSHMEQQHQQQHNYNHRSGPTTRAVKRKQPPTMTSPEKATKQLKVAPESSPDGPAASAAPATNGITNGSRGCKQSTATSKRVTGVGSDANANVLDGSEASGYESDTSMSPAITQAAQGADTAEWQATIEGVVKSVVSIHFCQTHSFDTEQALSSEATGFVVDAERGYILTNRHVVGAGPFWGYCIFDNHEECDVYPVYRDPVHDFGILRFDPKAIKYMPLTALELKPDQARVGVEIRVVGNDAGEKLSILSGVISRLDRNAPEYGDGYCDFNTNYIQAAASASGGSSGSPVVNLDGNAVALQAGGRSDGASTDYFLPLDRPFRALECIRKGEHVARGTIQTQWLLKPFDECRRLGLTPNWEAEMRKRFPKETGMLVAELVLPEGPAHEKIEEGDLLIKVNGELLTQFVRLDETLDSSVGNKVNLLVQRGGKDISFDVDVGDLHSITPDRFLNVAGASFHDLSYQLARINAISLKRAGVYVCEAMGSFRFDGSDLGWLVQSVDNKDTPDLDTFIEVMGNIPDRSRIVVTYKHLHDLHTLNTSIIFIDRHWYKKMRLAKRNDKTGLWDFTEIADALPPKPAEPRKANFIRMDNSKYPNAVDIVRSFVRISATMPIKLDGFPRTRKIGYGLVIDADKGLVIVSRAIVPYDMCDISITIADSIIVDGKVRFMHPLQNYAIIQYDPSLVMAPVQSARLSDKHIKQGDEIIFFGYNQNLRPVVGKTSVTDITTVAIPGGSMSPRYRAINLDAVTVDTNLASQCGSGVLISEDGTVQALWMTYLGERSSHSGKDTEYHLGLATPMLQTVLGQIQEGIQPELRILNVEMHSVQISQVRIMGVSEDWIERVEREDPERHQLFMVRKVDSGGIGGLQEGDVILTLNDKLISRVTDLDIMYNNSELEAVIVRKREEMRIKVATVPTADLETDRVVAFCGAVLHRPHHAVRQQISKVHSDVYVSGRLPGSPATMYTLGITNFITHVNGTPTPDLDSFLATATKIPDNTYFRLRMMTFENIPWVITMKKNEHYFPTVELVKDGNDKDCGWRRIVHECDVAGTGEAEDGMTIGLGGGADVGAGGGGSGDDGGGGGGGDGSGGIVPVRV